MPLNLYKQDNRDRFETSGQIKTGVEVTSLLKKQKHFKGYSNVIWLVTRPVIHEQKTCLSVCLDLHNEDSSISTSVVLLTSPAQVSKVCERSSSEQIFDWRWPDDCLSMWVLVNKINQAIIALAGREICWGCVCVISECWKALYEHQSKVYSSWLK